MSKWADLVTPKHGWYCIEMDDLGKVDATCAMCEYKRIRYVHTMVHPTGVRLRVGQICAGRMSGDEAAAVAREARLEQCASRRSRWLTFKGWRLSRGGNPYLNKSGYNIAAFRLSAGGWGFRVAERHGDAAWRSTRPFPSVDGAKLGAFEVLEALRENRTLPPYIEDAHQRRPVRGVVFGAIDLTA